MSDQNSRSAQEIETIRIRLTQIYDSYRTALMNQKYYRYKISRTQTVNLTFEILIAVGATGSGVSAWALWKNEIGGDVWLVIAAVSALLAIAKPIVQLSKKVEKYSKLYSGYTDICFKLKDLKESIEYNRVLVLEDNRRYQDIPGLFRELGILEENPPGKRLLAKCQKEVNREHPPESFWLPA